MVPKARHIDAPVLLKQISLLSKQMNYRWETLHWDGRFTMSVFHSFLVSVVTKKGVQPWRNKNH